MVVNRYGVVGFVLLCVAANARAEAIGRVALDRQPPNDGPIVPGPLLPRELFRQSLLIAARDELGASTRDATLGDPAAAAAGTLHLIPALNGRTAELRTDGRADPLWAGPLAEPAWTESLPDAVAEAERWSRGAWVDLLKKQGVDGRPNASVDAGEIAKPAAELLDRLELFAQLSALRLVHAQIRADGESPERLAALARGYANFGSLSRFVWSGASRAAAARSLLYGERAAAKYPKSPAALWGRLYARAVVGLPKAAAEDWAVISANKTPRPAWVESAGALARYDFTTLLAAAQKPGNAAPLAAYFAFLTVENSGASAAVNEAARLALDKSPQCQELMARINDATGPGIEVPASAAFARTLGTLDTLPGMNADLVKLLPVLRRPGGRPNGRLAMIETLDRAAATDAGEPSWHVAARVIADVTYVDAEAEAMHIAFNLGQPATGFVNSIWPLVEHHRYAPLMAGYRETDRGGRGAALAGMVKVRIDDPMLVSMSLISLHWVNASQPVTRAGIFELLGGTDALASDEELKARIFDFDARGGRIFDIGRLERLAPDSPIMMAAKIKNDWAAAEPQLGGWLERVGDHPSVTYAAAGAYAAANKDKLAADMLERYLAVSPDAKAYKMLAEMYLKQNDEASWLATLKRGLEQPSEGLTIAQTNDDIAQYFIARKRYEEALPYAEAAASSYAAWALSTAALVNERLGHWDRAEQYVRANAENYDDPARWLAWCMQTGHGDAAAAKKAYDDHLAATADHTDRETLTDRLLYAVLLDKPDAEKMAADLTSKTADPWAGLYGVTLAAARHDDAARDRFLTWTIDPAQPFRMPGGGGRPALIETAKLIRAAAAAKTARFDPAAVDRIANSVAEDAPNVYYFIARYAEAGGETEQAKAFYQKAVDSPADKNNRALAAIRLRALNGEKR